MKPLYQLLVVYLVLFFVQTFAAAQTSDVISTEMIERAEQEGNKPGLCYKPVKKCNMRQLSAEEIDTATAMADEVAFKLKEIETEEKKSGRDFKVALIGRAGTDLNKFTVLKDKDQSGRLISMNELVQNLTLDSQMSQHEGQVFDGGFNYQAIRGWTDKSRKMEYSHIGIALKNHSKSDKNGHWLVMHLLWTCDKDAARGVTEGDRSYIWEEGLGAVFADDMKEYKAQILVPQQTMQNRIEKMLLKNKLGASWHSKKYNAAALSQDLDQQNSNQWVLEVIAAASRPDGEIVDRSQAQKVLAETEYFETKVTPRGLYSLITLPFIKNILPGTVCMQRQPYFSRGLGEIISVLSIEEYMQRNNWLVRPPVVVKLPDELNFTKK